MFPDYDQDQTAGLLDRLLHAGQQRRRYVGETHPAMPRFQGREYPLDVQLEAVRRRDARMRELNRPAPEPGLLARVAETVAAAVLSVPQTEIAKAVTWLQATLGNGPVPEKQVQDRARNAGIKASHFETCEGPGWRESLRIGQSRWDWALPT